MIPNDGETIRKTCQRWNTPWQAHELTFSCFKRRAFLSRDRTRGYVIDAINRARDRYGFRVWAYVIMPEHVHLLLWPGRERYDISGILKSIKQAVARRAVLWLKANHPEGLRFLATGQPTKPYQFWQDGGGYDRNIRGPAAVREMFTYIHRNPVVRKLVARATDWPWSSARDWEDVAVGPIPIDKQSCIDYMF